MQATKQQYVLCHEEKKLIPRLIGEILTEILRSNSLFAICYHRFKAGETMRKEVCDGK